MDRRQPPGAAPRPNAERPQRPENDNGWGTFLGIAAGVAAAAAAGAYLLSRVDDERSSTSTTRSTIVTNSSAARPSQRFTEHSSTSTHSRTVYPTPTSMIKNELILAVDASPTSGGGILRLCNGARKIVYFYSVNWSNYFKFPHQSDKFEMVNALLALLSLKQQIDSLSRESWLEFILKVDNNFIKTSKYSNEEDDEMLQKFKSELSRVNGTSELVSQGSDNDMMNANQLSKGGAEGWIRFNLQEHYKDYILRDMSDEVEKYLRQVFQYIVPTKYHAA